MANYFHTEIIELLPVPIGRVTFNLLQALDNPRRKLGAYLDNVTDKGPALIPTIDYKAYVGVELAARVVKFGGMRCIDFCI